MKYPIQPTPISKFKLFQCSMALAFALFAVPNYAASVVVNTGTGTDAVSLSEVRAIFSMRLRRWPNGQPVAVFVLKADSPAHQDFCKSILNIYPHQLQASWDRMVYSGTGKAPVQVNSIAEMLSNVAATPGAIGYVDKVDAADIRVKEVVLR